MVGRKYGKIVSISSDAGRVGSTGRRSIPPAREDHRLHQDPGPGDGRYQINVNCVCPGATDTPLLAEITAGETGAKIIEAMVKAVPFRRLGKPKTSPAQWLSSPPTKPHSSPARP